jgi:hypothetical protein
MGHLDKIRSIEISDKQDLMDITSEAGTYSKEFENGVVLTVTIDKGKMVKYEAKDNAGNSLKTSILQMRSPQEEGQVCYVCWHVDDGDYGVGRQFCGKLNCHLV